MPDADPALLRHLRAASAVASTTDTAGRPIVAAASSERESAAVVIVDAIENRTVAEFSPATLGTVHRGKPTGIFVQTYTKSSGSAYRVLLTMEVWASRHARKPTRTQAHARARAPTHTDTNTS